MSKEQKLSGLNVFSSVVLRKAQFILYPITYVEIVIQIKKSNEMEQTCCLADLFHVTL